MGLDCTIVWLGLLITNKEKGRQRVSGLFSCVFVVFMVK